MFSVTDMGKLNYMETIISYIFGEKTWANDIFLNTAKQ